MNQLKVIKETEIFNKDFKIYGTTEEPLFLAKDVANWIEYDSSSVNKLVGLVDEDEKLNGIIFLSGQNREMWFLTEDGLYEVLMQSRKPIAKQFKKQVKKILKDIRLYGKYQVPSSYADALQLAAEQQHLIEMQKQMIGEYQPKVDYMDKVLKTKSLVTITQISKDYGLSGIAMNRLLRKLKVQFKQNDQWLLYREHQAKGYTKSVTVLVEDSYGDEKSIMQTKWTQKGRLFLYDLLKENGYVPLMEQENE